MEKTMNSGIVRAKMSLTDAEIDGLSGRAPKRPERAALDDAVDVMIHEQTALQQQPTLAHLIDGLRLEWVEHAIGVTPPSNPFSGRAASSQTAFGGYYVFMVKDGVGGCFWSCGDERHFCDSIEHGKQLALNHYKQRVRAIFKGV